MRHAARLIPFGASLMVGGALAWLHATPAQRVRRGFLAWRAGTGSIYDLMDADTQVVVPGTAPHCGTYGKAAFLRDVAAPFGARFAIPPVPKLRRLWAGAGTVAVLADATGITRDDRPYANTYLFVFEMAGARVTRVTEFLDMAAFNDVWDCVAPGPVYVSHPTDHQATSSRRTATSKGEAP